MNTLGLSGGNSRSLRFSAFAKKLRRYSPNAKDKEAVFARDVAGYSRQAKDGSSYGEKGIALLFTLGILTIILVLALGFATTSITQRRSAATNVHGTVARLLAESTLERVLASLQTYEESQIACSHCDSNTQFSAVTPPAENRGKNDWLYRLGTSDTGTTTGGVFSWDPDYANINWEFITVPEGGVDKIIGRVAYVIAYVPITGSGSSAGSGIDPGVLVKNGVKFGVNERFNTEPRPGAEVNEINLLSIDSKITSSSGGIADKMNWQGINTSGREQGMYNGNWLSFTDLFNAVGITDQSTKDNFMKWFVIDAKDESEAYWADDNNDGSIGATEMYHRFNLARTDWDTMTVAQILATPVAADKYNESVGWYNGGGLRWLANFGKNVSGNDDQSLKGNFPYDSSNPNNTGVAARRKQIAANLIDHCDTNSSPTTDYSESGGAATVTYMGNERTPRINEVNIGLRAVCTKLANSKGKSKANLVIYSSVGGELINIYGDNFNQPATLTVSYSVTATVTCSRSGFAAFGTKTYDLSAGNNTTVITLGGAAPGYKYAASEYSIYTGENNDYENSTPTVEIANVSVTITEAKLTYGGVVVDYAKWPNTTTLAIMKGATAPPAGGWEQRAYFGCLQADDPRQHMFASEWSAGTTDSGSGTYAYGTGGTTKGTPNAANEGVSMSSSGKDTEIGNDPSYDFTSTPPAPRISTAYIRNGSMTSPWELGCIHRGVKWETINLKEYNAAAGANSSTGGGLYKDSTGGINPVIVNGGDANILDQIKMTNRVKGSQKVNLTIKSDDTEVLGGVTVGRGVLSGLFKKIRVGSSYANTPRMFWSGQSENQLPHSGNIIRGDRCIAGGSDKLYTWNGTDWDEADNSIGDCFVKASNGDYKFYDGIGGGWNSSWSETGTEISDSDVIDIVTEIKSKSKDFKTRANVANMASLKNRTGTAAQFNDRMKEEIIGKTVNLTSLSLSGYFSIIVIAQSIKDVGGGITVRKDLDMNGSIGTANETILGADINGNGLATDTSDASGGLNETISNCAFGVYDRNADEIMAEQKIRADVYKDPITKKCTIIKMQYLEE